MAARRVAPEHGYIAVLEAQSNDITQPPEWPGLDEARGVSVQLLTRGQAHVFEFAVYRTGP
jgi:hypothetical protein